MARSWSVVVRWVLVLMLGVTAGHALGAGVLAVPGAEVAAWRTWTATTDPLVMVMALLRVVGLAAGWYLLATTALGVLARMLRAVRLVHLADAISAPVVRRVLQRGMGVMMATALVASVSAPAARAAEPPPVAALQGDPSTLTMRGVVPEIDGREPEGVPAATLPWQRFLAPESPGAADGAAGTDDRAAVNGAERAVGAGSATHTVRAGESLWSIAETRLAAVRGRAPRDTEVVPYWRELIERNRERLVVADDPDLIVPGQELVLPVVGRS